jgi:hypothetical protein
MKIKDDLAGTSVQSNDYFTKFNELNLDTETLNRLQKEYESMKMNT